MTHKDVFDSIGIRPPKGVLLYGPPGTGKTLIARACAAQTNATYLKLAGPQLVQMFIGDGAKLVRDAFALAKAGKLSPDAVVKLLASFHSETNATVWDAIDLTLRGFDRVIMSGMSDAIYAKFVKFVAGLMKGISEKVGWEKRSSDGHLEGLLRQTIVSMQSKYSSDEAVVADARRRFEAYLAGDKSLLPDDIKVAVLKIALKAGGCKEYDALRSACEKAETNLEKTHIYSAIGHVPDMAKKGEVLEWAISGEIKIQDFFYSVGSVSASTKAAVPMTWAFFKDNFSKVQGMTKSASPSLMDTMIDMSTRNFCTVEAADDIEAFFKANPLPQNKRKIGQILEEMRANAKFLERMLKTPINEEQFWDALTVHSKL